MLSAISKLNNSGLIGCSDLVSLISKCKWGPEDPPVLPEYAIISPLETVISKESK